MRLLLCPGEEARVSDGGGQGAGPRLRDHHRRHPVQPLQVRGKHQPLKAPCSALLQGAGSPAVKIPTRRLRAAACRVHPWLSANVHSISMGWWAHRATAVAARYLGLDCHLILRNSHALADADPGLTGNLLVARLAGAEIHQVCTLQDCILFRSLQGGLGCRRRLRW